MYRIIPDWENSKRYYDKNINLSVGKNKSQVPIIIITPNYNYIRRNGDVNGIIKTRNIDTL